MGPRGKGGRFRLSAPPAALQDAPPPRPPNQSLASLRLRGSGGAAQDSGPGEGNGTLWLGKEQCYRPGLGKGRE